MARKNSIISAAFNAGTITISVEGVDTIILPIASLSDDLRERAMVHGLVQKISDGAAIPKTELTGLSEQEIAERKFNAMSAIADRLRGGEWSKRNGDGSGSTPAGVIYRAFHQWACEMATAKKAAIPTETATREVYDKKDRAGQLALRNIPRIAEIIETLRVKPSNAVDTDSLLSDLGL